jgi:hypothetical protein
MNNKFNEAILPLIQNSKLNEKLKEINNKLREFRKVNEKTIKNIRHNVIGHKDVSAKLQLEIIESIDHNQLMQLNLQIVNLVRELDIFMSEIFLKL